MLAVHRIFFSTHSWRFWNKNATLTTAAAPTVAKAFLAQVTNYISHLSVALILAKGVDNLEISQFFLASIMQCF
jgi:hypothetical protein